MHGEYKVQDGKLVVVDFDVEDGTIAHFALSGDFFMEPDEVFHIINDAVNGTPAALDTQTLADRITAALPRDSVLLGFSPRAVAVAVKRGLAQATSWRDYDWELVHVGPQPPHLHLALDQVLTEEVAAGRRAPTLRIWEWDKPAVVIGSFQSVRNEVDSDNARELGIPVVRRITGGGAMFMEAGNVVTYSLYAPTALVQGLSFEDSYAFLDAWVLDALRSLGVNAFYKPLNDISSDRGKIGGAAQKRLAAGAVLHHVTMSYDIDADAMVRVLRIGREKISDKGIRSANKRVDPLRSQTGLPRAAIIDRLIDTFREEHGLREGALTDAEVVRAEELVRTKFGTDEWLYRVP